jgi:1-acyl-sn-glycerol-3-phosphate acyltransferase
MWFIGPLRFTGLENVPRQGAFILVANHQSNLDPLIIAATAGDKVGLLVHFMAKEELRHWPIIGWLASQAGQYFVRRGEGDRLAQRISFELLANGEPIGMFPEGTRSKTGILQAGRNGAAFLAIRAGVPLLPVSITGSGRLFPKGSRVPHRSKVTVRIGEPFEVAHRPDGRIDRAELTATTDRIMREIAALLPPNARRPFA